MVAAIPVICLPFHIPFLATDRYTSFTALTSFYVFGLLLEDYAAALFLLGFVVTFVGQVSTLLPAMKWLLSRTSDA